jgi:hypothetical protein
MKKLFFFTLAVSGFILLSATQSYSQARSSVGIGAGINYPLQSGYHVGRDRVLFANFRTSNKITIMPSIGLESTESDKKGVYNGYYFVGSGRSVDLFFLNLSAKYYFQKSFFAFGGPAVYLGGDDLGSAGIGGQFGAGYDWNFDDYSSFELSLRSELLPVYDKTVPTAALRVAYKFNFSRK